MKFMYLKFIIFLLLPFSLMAQQEVEVSYEQKKNKTYSSLHPEAVITQEMNKRELKRWQKH